MKECITHHYACDCREKKFKELYDKTNALMAHIGAYGEAQPRSSVVMDVMFALEELDYGEYNPLKVFGSK